MEPTAEDFTTSKEISYEDSCKGCSFATEGETGNNCYENPIVVELDMIHGDCADNGHIYVPVEVTRLPDLRIDNEHEMLQS
jgi:hypothetical protein